MAKTQTKQLTVERMSQYGILCQGVWYNISKDSDVKLTDFMVGGTYEVEVSPWKDKFYINGVNTKVQVEGIVKLDQVEKQVKSSIPVQNTDYQQQQDKKRKEIQAQGTIQAAVQAPALQMFATNFDEWWITVEKTAKAQLKFIQENS